METDGIQKLLKAEEEAAETVRKAREAKSARLLQASDEAARSVNELKAKLDAQFRDEISKRGDDDAGFSSRLAASVDRERNEIAAGYNANVDQVVKLLVAHTTSIDLTVSEALKQMLLSSAQQQ